MDPPHKNLIELLHGTDQLKWTALNSHNIKRFSENEIEKITRKNRTMVGQGAFGKVYAGTLEDKGMVAVKKLDHNESKMREYLAKEIIVHSQINHRNVTRLIGYCLEENALMMVTEYMPGGNLNDILHRDVRPISLDTRLRIAMECAEALGYIHSHMYTPVIHGDIKPANILLNHKLNAKISDFGISRLVNTDNTLYTMHVMGSIGYMDPLFVRTGHLTPKSDVYSFGVVLLEIFTRKKVKTDNNGLSLVDSFILSHSKGYRRVRKMFDAEISDGGNTKILEGIAKLIGECLGMKIHKRPEMKIVAERLQVLRRAHHQGQERVGLFSWGRKNILDFSAERIKGLLESRGQVIGQGILGKMYKVTLDSGTVLAMKRMKGDFQLPEEEFKRRIAVINDIQNLLVMPLLWYYYYSNNEWLLAYDYMPMGSLAALLHDKSYAGARLDWEQRVGIALNVAHGVAAIHSAGPAVCHGNIKSSNILLTSDCDVRLSEHGLHTLSCISLSSVSGYHSPEVTVISSDVTKQSDTYSFGILLLELLTGKSPEHMLLKEGVDLPHWVQSVPRKEWTTKVLDAELHKQQKSAVVEMQKLLHLATVCCARTAIKRPTIFEVVQQMERIRRFSIVHWGSAPAEPSIPVKETELAVEQKQDVSANKIYEIQNKLASQESTGKIVSPQKRDVSANKIYEIQNKLALQESTGKLVSPLATMIELVLLGGSGSFGTTWKVTTTEREGIMVMKLIENVDLPEAEFDRRIAAIEAIKSELLVPLHWHHFGNGEKILMYSYMPMGSLSLLLHGNGDYGKFKLDWEQQTTIALTVAHGLAAIHSAGPRACHGNIKSSNILLTSDYEARLSEHGVYTLLNMSSFVDATRVSGYLAPEVTADTRVTKEADVYSFGILLIELLTAREPAEASLRGKGLDLSRWVHSIAREDWMTKVFDVELVAQHSAAAQEMEQLLHLAMDCCTSFNLRPKISEVVSRIEHVRASGSLGSPPRKIYKSMGNPLPEGHADDQKWMEFMGTINEDLEDVPP
nr:uncharacterized protein LOC117837016 isoform X2 [Setaria viridis]